MEGAQLFKIKEIIVFLTLISSRLAIGGESCAVINGDDARASLSVSSGTLCFKLEHLLDKQGNPIPDKGYENEYQINVYLIANARPATKVTELPYLATTGKIEDAFLLDVNKDGKEDVIIIHSAELSNAATGACHASPWYSIIVLKQTESYLEYDERASRWFDNGSDFCKYDIFNTIVYIYPFKTRDAIKEAVATSPVASFIVNNTPRAAIVKYKSWLYDDGVGGLKTKKYLIAGDKVTLDNVQANMCQVSYSGGKKPLQMWMKCSDLSLESFNK